MAGGLRSVRGGLDAGDHPHQAWLLVPGGDDAFEAVDVVEVVDHDEPDTVLDRELEFLVALGVAVQHQPGRIGAGLERGEDLATARDVEVQALFDHDPLNGGARERLRGERHVAARPSAAERGQVVAGPLPQGILGDHDGRRAELLGHVVESAAADPQRAVVVEPGAGREEADQLVGRRLGMIVIGSACHCVAGCELIAKKSAKFALPSLGWATVCNDRYRDRPLTKKQQQGEQSRELILDATEND